MRGPTNFSLGRGMGVDFHVISLSPTTTNIYNNLPSTPPPSPWNLCFKDVIYFTNNNFFYTGFPNTLGCIDGTFIRILAPTENEPDFVNRKGFHSLNVQVRFLLFSYSIF